MKSFKYILMWMLLALLLYASVSFALFGIKELLIPVHLKHDMDSLFKNIFISCSAVIGATLGLIIAICRLTIASFKKDIKMFTILTILYFFGYAYVVFL